MIDTEFAAHLIAAPLAGVVGGIVCIALDVVNKPLMIVITIGALMLYVVLVFTIRASAQVINRLIMQRSN